MTRSRFVAVTRRLDSIEDTVAKLSRLIESRPKPSETWTAGVMLSTVKRELAAIREECEFSAQSRVRAIDMARRPASRRSA
jgi:hypothetical protein